MCELQCNYSVITHYNYSSLITDISYCLGAVWALSRRCLARHLDTAVWRCLSQCLACLADQDSEDARTLSALSALSALSGCLGCLAVWAVWAVWQKSHHSQGCQVTLRLSPAPL